MRYAVLGLLISVALPLASLWLLRKFAAGSRDWIDHVAAAQGWLTLTAIVFAALWYLIERPDAPKLEIEQAVMGIPLEKGRLLVLDEIKLKNIGGTALDLRRREFRLWFQEVTPVPSEVLADAARPVGAPNDAIRPADTWGAIAVFDGRTDDGGPSAWDGAGQLDSYLEAGETENLYYRAVLPCVPTLRIYSTVRIPKPVRRFSDEAQKNLWWFHQQLADFSEQCKPAKKGVRK